MRALTNQPIGFLVMAAGHSKRFGDNCKLTAALEGSTVLGCVLNQIKQACVYRSCFIKEGKTAAQAIGPAPIYVVTNTTNTDVQHLAKSYGAEVITLPTASTGLGCSLAFGVKATAHLKGWVVCLGDMPWISFQVYAQVLQRAYNACGLNASRLIEHRDCQVQIQDDGGIQAKGIQDKGIQDKGIQIAPSINGRRGHPVFFSQYYYTKLAALNADKGASSLIDDRLQTFNIDDAQALKDIDKPQDIPIK